MSQQLKKKTPSASETRVSTSYSLLLILSLIRFLVMTIKQQLQLIMEKIHFCGWTQTCYWSTSLILMPRRFSRSRSSRMFSFYLHYHVTCALCTHVKTCTHEHARAHTAKTINTFIFQILHKSHNYNAHHSFSVFLPVNHMNCNCLMNIFRGKGACFNLRWSLPLFQGQLTWTTPLPLLPFLFPSHLQFELKVKICDCESNKLNSSSFIY